MKIWEKVVSGLWGVILLLCTVLLISLVYERYDSMRTYEYRIVQTIPDLPALDLRDYELASATGGSPNFSPFIRLHKDGFGEKARFFCSAFIVSNAYAITAAHCLVDEHRKLSKDPIFVHDINNKDTSIIGTPAAVNIETDLGLIVGDFTHFSKMRISLHPSAFFLIPTETWLTCGFPLGDIFTCNRFAPSGNYYNFIGGSGFLEPGMSGGPVVSLPSLTVVAVNSATTSGGILVAPIIAIFSNAKIEVRQ